MVEAGLRWIAATSLLLAAVVAALALIAHWIAEPTSPESPVQTTGAAVLLAWPLFAAALGGLGWLMDGAEERDATQRPERRSAPRVKREAAVAFFALFVTTTNLARSANGDGLDPRQALSNLVAGVLLATIGIAAVRVHWHHRPRDRPGGGRPPSWPLVAHSSPLVEG